MAVFPLRETTVAELAFVFENCCVDSASSIWRVPT